MAREKVGAHALKGLISICMLHVKKGGNKCKLGCFEIHDARQRITKNMCIITGETRDVSGTNIFCAQTKDGRQLTVYSNKVELLLHEPPVSMILPCPNGKAGVEFVNLEKYPTLFEDLDACFPSNNQSFAMYAQSTNSSDSLQVFQVGRYVLCKKQTC